MAEAGLFIGWGEPVTGREAKGLEVFAEALAYYGKRRHVTAHAKCEIRALLLVCA